MSRGTGQRTDNRFADQCRESLPTTKCRDSAGFLSPSISCFPKICPDSRRNSACSKSHQLQRNRVFCSISASGTRSTTADFAGRDKRSQPPQQDAGGDCKNQKRDRSLPVHKLHLPQKIRVPCSIYSYPMPFSKKNLPKCGENKGISPNNSCHCLQESIFGAFSNFTLFWARVPAHHKHVLRTQFVTHEKTLEQRIHVHCDN